MLATRKKKPQARPPPPKRGSPQLEKNGGKYPDAIPWKNFPSHRRKIDPQSLSKQCPFFGNSWVLLEDNPPKKRHVKSPFPQSSPAFSFCVCAYLLHMVRHKHTCCSQQNGWKVIEWTDGGVEDVGIYLAKKYGWFCTLPHAGGTKHLQPLQASRATMANRFAAMTGHASKSLNFFR